MNDSKLIDPVENTISLKMLWFVCGNCNNSGLSEFLPNVCACGNPDWKINRYQKAYIVGGEDWFISELTLEQQLIEAGFVRMDSHNNFFNRGSLQVNINDVSHCERVLREVKLNG
jgi:hypothetical protein